MPHYSIFSNIPPYFPLRTPTIGNGASDTLCLNLNPRSLTPFTFSHVITFSFFGLLGLGFMKERNMSKRDISHLSFEELDKQILAKIKADSQIYKVYIYLRDSGNLTVKRSLELWGYYYLPVSINRLRKHGANIQDVNVIELSGKRYSKTRREKYAEYKLVK
jgi:hypothetical protein